MVTQAVTRGIPGTYVHATVSAKPAEPIDVELARRQHQGYVNALKSLGLEVTELPPDDRFPDSCFVEDSTVFHNGVALLANIGAASRRGEEIEIRQRLEPYARVVSMSPPATLDGGDCLRVENRLYVGHSTRTNGDGIARVREVFEPAGLEVVAVPVAEHLHLKCVCSYLGNGVMLLAEGSIPADTFKDVDVITVPREEAYAANCVSVNGGVLAAAGYPRTHQAIQAAGFRVIPLETSEIKKGDGSLTCLSILF